MYFSTIPPQEANFDRLFQIAFKLKNWSNQNKILILVLRINVPFSLNNEVEKTWVANKPKMATRSLSVFVFGSCYDNNIFSKKLQMRGSINLFGQQDLK